MKKLTAYRIEAKTLDQLKLLADVDRVPVSVLIRIAIEDYLHNRLNKKP